MVCFIGAANTDLSLEPHGLRTQTYHPASCDRPDGNNYRGNDEEIWYTDTNVTI